MCRNRPRTLYIRPGVRQPRSVLLHELGHLFDRRVMNNRDRGRFRRVVRAPRRKWWAGRIPLAERFAEAYSFCARYPRVIAIGRYASRPRRSRAPTRCRHRSRGPTRVPGSQPRPQPTPTPTATPRPVPTPLPVPVPTIFPLR